MQFKPSLTPLLPPSSTLAVLVTLVAIHCSALLPFLSKLTAPPFAPFAPFAPQPPSPLQISLPPFLPLNHMMVIHTTHLCKQCDASCLQPSLIEPEFLPPIWSGRGWFLRVAFKTTMTCFDDHLLRSIFCYRCVADALRWCVVIKTCFSTDSEVVPQIVILFFPVPEQTDNWSWNNSANLEVVPQIVILSFQYLNKQTTALREVNDSRLRIYEQVLSHSPQKNFMIRVS